MIPEERIAELERLVEAQRRTIAVLSDTVETRFSSESSDLQLGVEMARLERLVGERTAELAQQKAAAERTLVELKATQVHLLQSQKLEAIGQLAAGIAHEINTPMQYIGDNTHFIEKAFAELLAAQPAPAAVDAHEDTQTAAERRLARLRERVPRAISATVEGIEAVSRIVRAMKEFSHPGTGARSGFDLNESIRATLVVSRNEWKYAASVELDLLDSLPLAFGLRDQINQVLLNILVNAAHAVTDRHSAGGDSGTEGRIRIATRHESPWIIVEVADNGTGIPQAIRGRIFDPFFTTKPIGRGTGQGLAIARSIVVDQHGGTIDVTSDDAVDSPERGTRFVIRLPAVGGQPRGGAP